MLRWFPLLLSVVCWVGCNDGTSSNGLTEARPVVMDSSVPADMHTATLDLAIDPSTLDSAVNRADMQTFDDGVGYDTSVEPADMSVASLMDVAVTDSELIEASDASVDVSIRDSNGQCALNDDCPESSTGAGSCSRALPGGACLGCVGDVQCPGTSECSDFGACITPCDMDQECSPGLVCLRSGRCAAQSCVDGSCPDPRFTCSASNQCARAPCAGDQDCHGGMFCLERLCVQQVWQ